MKSSVSIIARVLTLVLLAAGLNLHADDLKAIEDWKGLEISIEALKSMMEGSVSAHAPNVTGEDEHVLAVLAEYDKTLKPQITQQLAEFSMRYGEVNEMDETLRGRIEIDWRSGKHPSTAASQLYQALSDMAMRIEQACANRAQTLLQESKELFESIQRFPAWVTDENFTKLQKGLQFALAYQPSNTEVQEWLGKVAEQQKEALAAIRKKIEDAKWPGHAADFAGPGNPDELAEAALKWIQNDERESGRRDRTFAVAVRGDWVIAKKNITGQTIQWGLPIWAACCFEEEKDAGNCRVFSLTILTKVGGPDIKKDPPWTYTWVGDNYTMRIKNVNGSGVIEGVKAGRVKAVKDSPGQASVGGWSKWILRLALVAANLLAGLLVVSAWVLLLVPAASKGYAFLEPRRALIGVVTLAVGLFVFLVDLLRLAPLASILPVAGAVVCGLLLGKDLLMEMAAGTRFGPAINTGIEKHKGLITGLEDRRLLVGWGCIALAVLHLLFGGVILL